jgi:hypothetical protein
MLPRRKSRVPGVLMRLLIAVILWGIVIWAIWLLVLNYIDTY